MNASVGNQALERNAGHFAAHRLKARKGNGLGRVVDDQINARHRLDGAYVAALTADDAALHLIVGQRHDADGGLRHMIGGAALNRHGYNLAGGFLRLVACLLFKLHELDGLVVRQLILEVLQQVILGLLHGEAGDSLQHLKLALLDGFRLAETLLRLLDFVVQDLFLVLQTLDLLVERLLLLLDAALLALHLLAAIVELLLALAAQTVDFVLPLQNSLLLLRFRVLDGLADNALGLLLRGSYRKFSCLLSMRDASQETHGSGRGSAHNRDDDGYYNRYQVDWTPPCPSRQRRVMLSIPPARSVSRNAKRLGHPRAGRPNGFSLTLSYPFSPCLKRSKRPKGASFLPASHRGLRAPVPPAART